MSRETCDEIRMSEVIAMEEQEQFGLDARSRRICARWDALWAEGKQGHYETMMRVVNEEVERARNLVVGWREYDWPECFDPYTADLIADHLDDRL